MIKEKQQPQAAKKKGNGNDGGSTGGSGGGGGGGNGGGGGSGSGNVGVGIETGTGGPSGDVKEGTGDTGQAIVGNNQVINTSGTGPEVKEEPDEPEPQDSLHDSHDSPLDDVHQSPTLQHPPDNTPKEVQGTILQNSLPCKNNTKSENGDNTDNTFRNEACDGVESVSVGVGVGGGVQPLASNVPKQPVGLDAQYMQQQSQIFVFSTALANKAADAVMQGHFASIIAYHCSQPRTKKYLEGSNRPGGGSIGGQCSGNTGGSGPISIEQAARELKGTGPSNHHQMMSSHVLTEGMMTPLSDVSQDMGLSAPQPLAGVKVPDENLTPQQRQHREEQLATLRKMQQILFPEALSGSGEEGPQEQPPPTSHDSSLDLNKAGGSSGDWHKLQMQMYEEQKGRGKNGANAGGGNANSGGGARGTSAGPPPSYQQATRSASVPIALQSPSPASPNNTTSNLSLPSPRTCSGGINSPHPSDKVPPSPAQVRSAAGASSNPPTPLSSHHLSPKHKDKLPAPNEFSPSSNTSAQNSQQSPVESLYCRAVSQKGGQGGKEPNLMPVPSPQQIQYLNTFEGQELTIQKQPNTSLKESSQKSPPMCVGVGANSNLENVVPGAGSNDKVSGSSPRHGPGTPDVVGGRGFPSELDSSGTDKGSQAQQVPHQRKMEPTNFSTSPHSNDRCHMGVFLSGKCGVSGVSGVYMDQPVMTGKCTGNTGNGGGPPQQDKELGPGYTCIGPDNVPLNPNRSVVPTPGKGSHFDPISSLAQMSQQLTNSVPSSPAAQPISNMHQGMGFNTGGPNQMLMGEAAMHHMGGPPQGQMQHFNPRGQCATTMGPAMSVSPKMLQGYPMSQRPMSRMGYNGASIQVKPNAPNTIQYLPSRGQPGGPPNVGVGVGVSVGVGGSGPGQVPPRGAPSLDFLQRFSSPLSNLDAKLPTHNLQYFPNNYPQGNITDMGMCTGGMRAGLRTNNQSGMLRLQAPGVPSPAQMSPIGFGGSDGFQTNCQLLGGGGGGKGLAPDASQPLPPSMGQANNFKNSAFIGPTTADPNYAQQFHNFQQQLYATNTRGQLGAQGMPPGQHYFVPK